MKQKTAKILTNLTCEFYRSCADSFSESRNHPWPGWQCAVKTIIEDQNSEEKSSLKSKQLFNNETTMTVFDLACGNLRFEKFLLEYYPRVHFELYAADATPELLGQDIVSFQECDFISALIEGKSLDEVLAAPTCDLVVAFGILHHIPSFELRVALLRALIDKTNPGGYIVVSFWEFMKHEKLAAKSVAAHEHALAIHPEIDENDLEEEDYLLGWRDDDQAVRYCHNFTEEEIARLVSEVSDQARLVSNYCADGRTDNLNEYIILQVI